MRKAFIIFGVIIIVTVIYIGIVGHDAPIFFKYLVGSANNLGKPIDAKVYASGRINNGIKIYKDPNYQNDYLLSLKEFDTIGMLRHVNVDLVNKWVCRPVGADYDIISGNLYQSEVGAHFVDFKDDMKGFNFDPKLRFNDTSAEFKAPPLQLKFDSIRIVLKHS
jgi:hypothetical protein